MMTLALVLATTASKGSKVANIYVIGGGMDVVW